MTTTMPRIHVALMGIEKLIPKGATLQVGIGAVADAVVDGLVAKKQQLAAVHSELLGPALIKLSDAGVIRIVDIDW